MNKKIKHILLICLCCFATTANLFALSQDDLVPTYKFGYAYDDDAAIVDFISPIQEGWGNLIDVRRIGREERWVFDNEQQITIVYVTIREDLPAKQKLLLVNNIWNIYKVKKD